MFFENKFNIQHSALRYNLICEKNRELNLTWIVDCYDKLLHFITKLKSKTGWSFLKPICQLRSHCRPGIHNIRPEGQKWPTMAFNLTRYSQTLVAINTLFCRKIIWIRKDWLILSLNWNFSCSTLPKTRCHFHQHFTSSIFLRKRFPQLFSTYSLGLKEFGKRIWRKSCL